MNKRLYDIISEKLWETHKPEDKRLLYKLLGIAVLALLLALVNVVLSLFTETDIGDLICDWGVLAIIVLALVSALNGKANLTLYTVFSIPLFIYAYYISDFSQHPPLIETVYLSVWWLLAGLILLLLFTEAESMIILYSVISFFTIGFHLLKANRLFDSFSYYEPFVTHPLLVFGAFVFLAFILRQKMNTIVSGLSEQLKIFGQSVNKVIQDSENSIVQISAERDEDGNIMKFIIDKVNNSFESSFKLNLYEVQGQDAGYIFELIFKTHFDLNKTLLMEQRKTKEFYAKNLERHFKLHVLKPEFSKYLLVFEDVTKVKLKIAELEESKRRYKVLLEAIPDIFFVIDKDGTYEDFVIKESDIFKIEDVNIIGNTIYDVGFPDNMADKIYQCIQNCLRTNSIESIEYSLNTHNGTFMFEMRLAKLSAHSVISVARDITRRKTAEFKLERALNKAEESDRLKSAFLANLSHEIRTPLNIITNLTNILAETDPGSEEKTFLSDGISQNAHQLLNMIDNTIHLSRIETESIEVHIGFCKVNDMLREIYSKHFAMIPDSKDVRLKLDLDVPNPVFGFETDARLLRETINILVDNAIKYTLKGEVILSYEMVRNEAVKFVVSDTGIGIPAEEQENIFSRFYRVKNKINDTTSGSGLGLPIAQHYVTLLGSELELKSIPGQGSKFSFILPFRGGKGFLTLVS